MGTIFLAGVYGVGKSTLADKLSAKTGIKNYSAGDLISNANGETYGANKVVSDKNKNQDILADAVSSILKTEQTILLAGHLCILGKDGNVDALPENVFYKLSIEKIILLETDVNTICRHLSERDHKDYSSNLIEEFLLTERELANKISQSLSVPFITHTMTYNNSDIEILVSELQ